MNPRALLLFALAIGCSSGADADPATAQPDTAVSCDPLVPYAAPGSFVPGVTTVDIGGVVTEVWYPADRGSEAGKKPDVYDMRNWLPASERTKIPDAATPLHTTTAYRDLPVSKVGKYPIVLFSHGLGGYRLQSSFLMAHLASWGFVVAAPDHVERGLAIVLEGDLSKIEDKGAEQLRAALAFLQKSERFAPVLDGAHVAAVGHSMGGAAVSTVIDDATVSAGVWLASGGFGEAEAGKALMMVWGTADRVAKKDAIEQAFGKQPAGTRGVAIDDAGHMAFTDLCVIGKDRGGVLQIAADHGIKVDDLVKQLASDGCGEQPGGAKYLAPEEGWPVINHYVTAHLKSAFEKSNVGLDEAAKKCFGERVAALQTK